MTTERISVIVISGPCGVGKTTTAWELRDILRERGIAHALIDTDNISWCYDPASTDRFNTHLVEKNLEAIWENYRSAGVRRLIISGVLETSEQLAAWTNGIPKADFTVIELRATKKTLCERITARAESRSNERELTRSLELTDILAVATIPRHVLDTDGLTRGEVAARVLECSGWR